MNDADYTDEVEKRLARKLYKIYKQAEKEISDGLKEFVEKNAEKEAAFAELVKDGKRTQKEFDEWKQKNLYIGKAWEAEAKNAAYVLAHSNEIATELVNGEQIDVFQYSENFAAYEFEHGFGVNLGFDVYDEKTVMRLIKDDPSILPFKKLDKVKDVRWNMKNIRSQVAQGIIQGESVNQVAKRLASVVPNRNEKQMRLHARTALTSAHNGGRMERYKEAQRLGIKFKKVWLATYDGRTRDLHLGLDGQAVDPNEDFEIDGYALAYPGDPDGEPEMVYNCRCTMITELEDYPSERYGDPDDHIKEQSYEEWQEEKKEEPDAIKLPQTLFKKKQSEALEGFLNSVNGKDKDVAELYGTLADKASEKTYGIKVSYTDRGHCVSTSRYATNWNIADVDVKIPKMDGDPLSQSATTIHEVGHFIDQLYGGNSYFSLDNDKLRDAIEHGNMISDNVKTLFEGLKADGQNAYENVMVVAREKNKEFNNRIREAYDSKDWTLANKLSKERDKSWKNYVKNAADEMRAAHKGYDGLEDIYDAIYGGKFQREGYYGHGADYYSNVNNKIVETFANYCAMSQTNPAAFEMLKKEQPGIFNACRDLVKDMLRRK